jgi:GT2 family glycosyltransferase
MESVKRLMINIVTWNSARYLPNLFVSLDQQASTELTVTVVDNASTDATVAWLTEQRPQAMLLKNFRNLGFARAHNQAIALALSRWEGMDLSQCYVMVANPDLELDPFCIERVIECMDAHPEVGSCAPKLLRAVATQESDDTQLTAERTNVIDAMGIAVAKSRRVIDRGAGEKDTGQYDAASRVFGASGACAVYRASALQQVRLTNGEWFDEDFFMYQEDVDLAWRLQLQGLPCRLVPSAVAWHYRRSPGHAGGWVTAWRARRSRSPHINYYSSRNHAWLLLKNDHVGNLLRHIIWWLPYECAKAVAGFFSPAQLRGQFASLAGIGRMLRKRAEIMQRATVASKHIREWFV